MAVVILLVAQCENWSVLVGLHVCVCIYVPLAVCSQTCSHPPCASVDAGKVLQF